MTTPSAWSKTLPKAAKDQNQPSSTISMKTTKKWVYGVWYMPVGQPTGPRLSAIYESRERAEAAAKKYPSEVSSSAVSMHDFFEGEDEA